MSYQSLDADKLTATVVRLKQRIDSRLPDTNLVRVADELVKLAEKARDATDRLTRPMIALRVISTLLVGVIAIGLTMTIVGITVEPLGFGDFLEALEAGINSAVLIGIGVFFLLSLERRMKRRITMASLSELRSIVHIIDMHQLTKDPQYAIRPIVDTAASPTRLHDRQMLTWYLDYCSELLSLSGKIAALYLQKFDDPVVLSAVNEIEGLTTGLAGKVWQKLMILEMGPAPDGPLQSSDPVAGSSDLDTRWR
ncbi:MAG: hypothetical protein MJB57_04780 [Gemmatimonadetes bacterium]|nr:hypothetical protein [Gemmatimonadota bacterium]